MLFPATPNPNATTRRVTIRSGRPEEAVALTALAVRSKAHWGYDAEFMELCRSELTMTADDVTKGTILVAEGNGTLLGFGCLSVDPDPGRSEGEIWNLFVDPAAMGRGIGRSLIESLAAEARRQGFRSLRLDADPHARGFYERMGFVHTREVPSASILGRMLPQMVIAL